MLQKEVRLIKEINVWSPHNTLKEIDGAAKRKGTTGITIFGAEEHEVVWEWYTTKSYKRVEKFAKKHPVNIVMGCFPTKTYWEQKSFPKNASVHLWTTFWASAILTQQYQQILHFEVTGMKKIFTSLNHNPHSHRCEMMDIVAEYNLIDDGTITWHYPEEKYDWKHWSPTKLLLDVPAGKDEILLGGIVDSYKDTFCSLVSESTSDLHFFTEKTWIHLFLMRPFLIAGAPGMHTRLQRLGFRLYHEIFDYSFDTVEDQTTRYRMIAENIASLKGKDLDQLRRQILPKLKYNYNLAVALATDLNRVPDVVFGLEDTQPQHSYVNVLKGMREIKSQSAS